jgi:putative oxidoreductase
MKTLSFLGRVVFGGFFLYNGINHLLHREQLTQYARAKNVPQPEAAIVASAIALLAGGGSLVLGLKPRFGTLPLATFLSIVSPVMHDFWNAAEESKQNEMIHFSKNLALLGAVLMLAASEKWPASIKA